MEVGGAQWPSKGPRGKAEELTLHAQVMLSFFCLCTDPIFASDLYPSSNRHSLETTSASSLALVTPVCQEPEA
jgi:hypothetical protein